MIDEVLSSLCALPHRSSTTANERRAAEYLRQKLEDMHIDANFVPFVAPTTFSWVYFMLYLGFLLSVIAGVYHPLVAAALSIFFAVLFYGEQTTRFTPLSRWVPQGLSHNVVAKIPAKSKAINTMVISAHYDTSKTSLAFSPAMVKNLRASYLASLAMIVLIMAGGIGRVFAPPGIDRIINWALVIPGACMAVMCLFMIERELRGVPVNGAADNASGVAVAVELANRLQKEEGLAGWDVIVLLTGSEEVGMEGMAHFISENEKRLPRKSTVFLNFDNVGGGRLHLISSEGMLYPLSADPELLQTAQKIVKSDERFSEVGTKGFHALTLDSLVARARGYRVLSLMGLDQNGLPHPWHWFNDTLENLDREVTRTAAELGWKIITATASKDVLGNDGS